ncbi:MAG TPA: LPS assembly protein LptD [Dongiaceae bacterium]|jgi:lipopolysaccharide assembly outer membrane protein LptD (OstA)|nr:LPS assembly protein LptD [Dongiaceae bacterium]
MRHPAIITGFLLLLLGAATVPAQEQKWVIKSLSGGEDFAYDLNTGTLVGTNGVYISFEGTELTADSVTFNQKQGQAQADGHVRIQRDDQLWVGEHIDYNFFTKQMQAEQYRSGKPPVFVGGAGLSGNFSVSNRLYSATNAIITTDDVADPAFLIRAREITVVPGKYVEAHGATLILDGVPVFYFPYYKRNLGEHANNFNFKPGYRSRFGAFLLTRYDWYWNDYLDGTLHFDARSRRGVALGPDFNYHLGPWGDGTLRYYYLYDQTPEKNANGVKVPHNRERVAFSYWANPATNLTIRSQVRYQSDPLLLRDFFEGEYNENVQPSTYVEVNKFWSNFSLDAVAQPRLDNFLETVERLPEVRLTGYRQQLGNTPVYYESESSVAYLQRLFAVSNSIPLGNDYAALRADTYHQLLLPYTFFNWLNVTPHAGGRFTYYSEASGPGATNAEAYRGVFDTGLRVSFKAAQTWAGVRNHLLELNGVRHILEPSLDYLFVPAPNHLPSYVPQFDSTLPSLRMLPNDFPEMNSVDSIDSQNVLRFGLRNQLQTKRDGQIVNFLDWSVFTDWRLHRSSDQPGLTSFSDIYSDLIFTPRSWLQFESQTRYNLADNNFRLAYHTVTLQPNNVWSWSLGHFYVHDDPLLGTGNNLITSRFFFRLNENWGVQFGHNFEARNGQLQEQYYSLYRDLRSWTTALTFRVSENTGQPTDYTVAVTFSLKALPRFGLGGDAVRPYSLFGG